MYYINTDDLNLKM